MTPDYREPDTRLLEHRNEIHALTIFVVLTGAVALVKAPDPVNIFGAAIAVAAIIVHGQLRMKWTPNSQDYYDFLTAKAEQGDLGEWLSSVDREFIRLWSIDIVGVEEDLSLLIKREVMVHD